MDCVAKRRFRHDGKEYRAGDKLRLKAGQFADWESVGLVEKVRPAAVRKPWPLPIAKTIEAPEAD